MSPQYWRFAPRGLRIEAGAVHVWRARLDRPDEEMTAFKSMLSADENERAARFHFDRDRKRYIAGRGILRVLLAHYLDLQAADIGFDYGIPAPFRFSPFTLQATTRERQQGKEHGSGSCISSTTFLRTMASLHVSAAADACRIARSIWTSGMCSIELLVCS